MFSDIWATPNKFDGDVSPLWEVGSAAVKRYNYFPDRYMTLPCGSFGEIECLENSFKNLYRINYKANKGSNIWKGRKVKGNDREKNFLRFSVVICRFIVNFKKGWMYKKVVIKAFNKAEEDISGRSNKTRQSEHISNALLDNFKFQISSRTLRNLYDDAIKNNEEDISINSNYIQYLCQYLGFENYNEFLKGYADGIAEPIDPHLLAIIKKNKIVLALSVLSVIIILSVSIFNKQRWMIWDDTHYVEVDFDAKKHSLGQLKLYNSNLIEHFFKINPDCSTHFFNTDGSVNLWYGKNTAGELEYFNAIAIHPETGKTLKEITVYMIKKHICENYPD